MPGKNLKSMVFRNGVLSAPLCEKLSRRNSAGEDIEIGWVRWNRGERPFGLENIVGKTMTLILYRRKLVGKI